MRPSFLALLTLLVILFVHLGVVLAQDTPPIQELSGSLAPGQVDVFLIKSLDKDQNLDVFAETISGNLDPVVSILPGDENLSSTLDVYKKAVADLAASSAYPLLELPALRDQYSLAWDDDSGPGASASLRFSVPEDGDYYLIVTSSSPQPGAPLPVSSACWWVWMLTGSGWDS
jgi:hypothetical protein